jgi:hypothetical protein
MTVQPATPASRVRDGLREEIRAAVTIEVPGEGPVCKLTEKELEAVVNLAGDYGCQMVEEYARPRYDRLFGGQWRPAPLRPVGR